MDKKTRQLLAIATTSLPPCESCRAACCFSTAGWAFVTLDEEEQKHPLFAPILELHEPTGKMGFSYLDEGHCRFLDVETKRCTVYEDRPQICRGFDCRTCVTGKFYDKNPDVWELIKNQAGV